MFGKHSDEGIKGVSAKRTDKAATLIKKFGGAVNSMYALPGKYDVVLIVDFPGIQEGIKASVALKKLTGILFTTVHAVTVQEFDTLMAEV